MIAGNPTPRIVANLRTQRGPPPVADRSVAQLIPCPTGGQPNAHTSLLSGEEMTAQRLSLPHLSGRRAVQSIHSPLSTCVLYVVARAFTKVAVLIRLLAITPSPTHRAVPSAPR
jgi:hypothetical protein